MRPSPRSSGSTTATAAATDARHATDLPLAPLLGQTRARIFDLLRATPQTIAELAASIGLSEESIRRHLRLLERDGLIASTPQQSGGRGRPTSVYSVSERGHKLYPDRTADLANELWQYLEIEHGRPAVLGFLRWRQRRQAARYAEALADDGGFDDRVDALAGLLSRDGFLADVTRVKTDDGRELLQLTQSHCAVLDVAAEHPEICAYEAAMFKELLGAKVSRRQTIAAGAARCVCTVEPPPRQSPPTAK